MKRIISTLLVFMSLVSLLDIYCSAEVKNTTLNIPIRSSLLYECLFEDEQYDEAKLDKALEEIEQIDPIEKVKISSITDYSHIDSGVIRLGNGEGVTVTLETTPSGIAFDDFVFHFDESLLTVTAKDIINDATKNKTTLHLIIHAKKPCRTSFEIYETYQFIDLDYDDSEGYSYTDVEIVGMNEAEGRVVYVTPTGEKYHFSSECAGENYITTTLNDALGYEYTACHKCAS